MGGNWPEAGARTGWDDAYGFASSGSRAQSCRLSHEVQNLHKVAAQRGHYSAGTFRGQCALFILGFAHIRGFPPLRQKEIARTGHGTWVRQLCNHPNAFCRASPSLPLSFQPSSPLFSRFSSPPVWAQERAWRVSLQRPLRAPLPWLAQAFWRRVWLALRLWLEPALPLPQGPDGAFAARA